MEKKEAPVKPLQLMMLHFPAERPQLELPEGYAVTKYNGTEEDIEGWLNVCRNGLLSAEAGREVFEGAILNRSDVDPLKDVIFIEHNGKKVATTTAITNFVEPGFAPNYGWVHMVAVSAEERGKGLAKFLNQAAEERFLEAGTRMVGLRTDEFRIPAIKSYLSAGFYPVNHAPDMPGRWTEVITALGIDSIQMVKINGEPDIFIHAKKD